MERKGVELEEHICGTFDIKVCKVMLGLFSALVPGCRVEQIDVWYSCAACNT